jgi:hypothetical protein
MGATDVRRALTVRVLVDGHPLDGQVPVTGRLGVDEQVRVDEAGGWRRFDPDTDRRSV